MDARIYDWNGVLVSTDGFRGWLREKHPRLFEEFYFVEKEEIQLKKKPDQELLGIYEKATNECLYPIFLLPRVTEKLKLDKNENCARLVFTSAPRSTVLSKITEFGLENLVDEIITIDDLAIGNLTKEDPKVFQYLAKHIVNLGLMPCAYTDDSQRRIMAAVEANRSLTREGQETIRKLYLFDPKTENQQKQGYQTVNDLLLVR